jgi:GNAT superfamily N-acetyltransferase
MLQLRPAVVDDVPLLFTMIQEFAEFERLREHLTITEDVLTRDGFGPNPRFQAMLAEWDGRPAGYAITYVFYSSFQGPALFLEDIYVRDEFRGKGIGIAMMAQIAETAMRQNYWSIHWEVLHWNTAAIDFYKSLGASFVDDWKTVCIDGEALQKLAQKRAQGEPAA